tara:strand:- start:4435 stop:5838 length:1404 start_codon:yes stop_codon:yes gene_type:complete
MADLIVQNASEKVKNAIAAASANINYADMLGMSLSAYLKQHIEANASDGVYTSASAASFAICDLSDKCLISWCQCSYAGSGQNCTCTYQTNSIWNAGNVLAAGAVTITQSDILNKFNAQSPKVLAKIYLIDNAAVQLAYYYAWLGLKDDFVADANATVLENWYGVSAGGGSNVQGKRLSDSNYLKVCATNWKYGYGPTTCTWTVPAGASTAKFQAWGAGKGTNPACCCGGAPFGMTGAYSEIVIKVTPGDTYTVCAGCSCSKYCCSNNEPGRGCASGVTGPGICCFNADGAHQNGGNCGALNMLRVNFGAGGACRRFQNPWCTDSGPCWCSYSEYCFDNSCATCGQVPVAPDCCNQNYCSCATSACKEVDGICYGHRGIVGGGCLDTNNYGWHARPPIIDADDGSHWDCTQGCYCASFSSNCCCGGCNGKDWDWHPGHGGSYTHVMGGNNTHKADTGRAGMVQISWT